MTYNKVEYAGKVLVDLTGDTVTSDTLFEGQTAHGKSGDAIVGTFSIEQEIAEQDALIEQLKTALACKVASYALNYSVIGDTVQPSSPAENTICVSTSTAITSHVFSATEPASPTEGMVWIMTAGQSAISFNALKKNGLMVYPIACKQYVSGAWVSKSASIRISDAWLPLESFVYKTGEKFFNFTDGDAGIVTWGDSALKLEVEAANTGGYVFTYTEAIDLSAFSELKLTYEDMLSYVYTGSDGTSYLSLGVIVDDTPTVEKSGIIANAVASATYKFPGNDATATYDGTLSVDISSIDKGKVVVALGNNSKSSQVPRYSNGFVTEIEMVVETV